MTGTQRRAIAAPSSGLIVYQTTSEITPPFSSGGFYIFSFGVWKMMLDSDDKYWSKSSSRNWIFNSNDSIGIGTTSPTTKFQVVGNALVQDGSLTIENTFPALYFKSGGTDLAQLRLGDIINGNHMRIGTALSNSTGSLMLTSQGVDRLTILSGGNVGIGTTNPGYKLDVAGDIRSRDNVLADNNITATGTVSGAALYTGGNITALGTGIFNGNLSTNANLSAAGTFTAGSISTGGNLTVLGTGVINNNLTTNADLSINNAAAVLQLKSSNVNKGFFQLSGNDVRFGTNSGNTTGNVILRMDGDDMIDYFKGASGIVMRLNNGAGANTGILQTLTTGNRFLISNPIANGTIELGDEIYINPTLNRTGLGTSAPSERLHVIGNAFITGTTKINGKTTINANLVADSIVTADVYANTLQLGSGYVSPTSSGLLAAGFATEVTGLSSAAIGNNVRVIDDLSYGIGSNVTISGRGTIALTDALGSQFTAGLDNAMFMRFRGGYRLWTDLNMTTGVLMNNGSNSWSSISDSTKKENFLYADGNLILKKIASMKLGSWNYKMQDKKTFRHYGPMAQEFDANFGNDGIGKIGNDTTIATADIDGVMMIAIQALEKRTTSQQESITKLEKENASLKARLEKLESYLNKQ